MLTESVKVPGHTGTVPGPYYPCFHSRRLSKEREECVIRTASLFIHLAVVKSGSGS
jgi:hypothetical protein